MDRNYDYKYGSLPEKGALAAAYVPLQRDASPAYGSNEALSQGTLFPGLDLPFMNTVNRKLSNTALTELMAIDFTAHELELYLDTHRDDREAFSLLKTILELKKEARKRYVERYGAIEISDMLGMSKYTWLSDPWPWDYRQEGEE